MTSDPSQFARLRREYDSAGLTESDLAADWHTQFRAWLSDAIAAGVPEPNAMTLATADPSGQPTARTVLLKSVDERGFVFVTNLRSPKATQALANPYASLVFCWLPLHRQVVVGGAVVELSRSEAEAFFRARPRGAQLSAWASPQSQVVSSREELEERFAQAAARFPGEVPMPRALGRVAGRPGDGRVLARATQPAARPAALPPGG